MRLIIYPINFAAIFKSNLIIRHIVSTTIFTIIGKGVGFFIPFFIAAWFGVSAKTDAFFFAYGLVLLVTIIFSSVVESVIVPYIAESRALQKDIGPLIGGVLVVGGIVMSFIAVIFLIITRPVLEKVSNFSTSDIELIHVILLQASPLVVLLVWTSVISGTFCALKLFKIPATSPAFRAIVILTTIYFLKGKYGIQSVVIAYVIAEICHLLLLVFLLRKFTHVRIRFLLESVGELIKFFKTSSSMVVGMTIMAFSPTINKTMASWLGPTNVSILEYADRLYQIPMSLMSLGFLSVLLSHWSDHFYIDNQVDFKRRVVRTTIFVGVVATIISILFVFASTQITQLAYQRGKFSDEFVSKTAGVFALYAIGLGPTLVGLVLGRAFLVLRKTRVFMVTGAVNILTNVSFNFILMPIFGIYGLALSTTLAYSIVGVVLIYMYRSD